MNGRKAKALRRKIYGETSLKIERTFTVKVKQLLGGINKVLAGGFTNTGKRREYQDTKKHCLNEVLK